MPAFAPPFRLDLTAWALRRRADNAVDRWDGRTYRRVLTLDSGNVEVAAVQVGSAAAPQLAVTLTGTRVDCRSQESARSVLTRLLGLNIDLSPFYELAARDSLLAALSERFRGLKPPRFPSLFECIVNAIACQQLTLTVGIRILNRLADTYGMATCSGVQHAFPRPARLAGLPPAALRPLGFSGAKARSIVELAETITAGRFDLRRSTRSTITPFSRRCCVYEASGAGRVSMPFCAASAGSTYSLATMLAHATTLRAG